MTIFLVYGVEGIVHSFGYLELPQMRSLALYLFLYDRNKHIIQALLYLMQNKVPRSLTQRNS